MTSATTGILPLLLALALATFTLGACGDEGGSEPLTDGGGPDASTLGWEDVESILSFNCLNCHTWASSHAGVADKVENDDLYGKVAAGHHISGAERALVLEWLEAGYPEL